MPLRLHALPHPFRTHPHSSLPHLPAPRRIYYPPLSAGPLKRPRLLNFMPWVNLVFASNGGCGAFLKWTASFFLIPFRAGGQRCRGMNLKWCYKGHKWRRKTNWLLNGLQVEAVTFVCLFFCYIYQTRLWLLLRSV